MVIYLKHPIHGQKVATLEAEAKADEAKGWERFQPVVAPSPNPVAVQLAETNVTPIRKGPGRPRKNGNG